ncbi:2-dehydropantoate 2-reductase [bacterium]|nr:2-dehydropantoate 2-reductase [bacterium]
MKIGKNKLMDIFFVGAGAVGSFYSSRLKKMGLSVGIQSSYSEMMSEKGLLVESRGTDFLFEPDVVFENIPKQRVSDIVVVTTKVLKGNSIAKDIKALVGKDTVIVLLQNGIGIEKEYSELYPNNVIVSGLAFICVSRRSPVHIVHQSHGKIVLGVFQESSTNRGADKLNQISKWFNESGVECKTTSSILRQRFKKLVWNAAFNPLSVLDGDRNTSDLIKHSEDTLRRAMDEVCILADAYNCSLNSELVDFMIEDTRKMPPYETSMLLDKKNGRALEVQAILGNALEMASLKKIDLPVLNGFYKRLLLKGFTD